jgi:SAM-dependent methyltransferase
MSDRDRDTWNERYRTATSRPPVSSFLRSLDAMLPRVGPALDVAGGAGQNAAWLADRGLAVTLLDVSDLALAQADPRLTRLHLDLDAHPLPPGPFAILLWLNFLDRRRLAEVATVLAPGGLFIFAHPTRHNLERHPSPSARFLLEPGEVEALVPSLEVLLRAEAWFDGRHEARLVARAPVERPTQR